jgi:hypothetical protein
MRVLHPADPPSWRNHDTSHDLPKLGIVGSIPGPPLSEKGLVSGGYRGEALRALVHQVELMHWLMQEEAYRPLVLGFSGEHS